MALLLFPNSEAAFIDIRKLRDYVLNSNHPEKRHKAKAFMSVLGVSGGDNAAMTIEFQYSM